MGVYPLHDPERGRWMVDGEGCSHARRQQLDFSLDTLCSGFAAVEAWIASHVQAILR